LQETLITFPIIRLVHSHNHVTTFSEESSDFRLSR